VEGFHLKKGDRLEMTVTDSGIRIPLEEQKEDEP
jgi:hypothetical protein